MLALTTTTARAAFALEALVERVPARVFGVEMYAVPLVPPEAYLVLAQKILVVILQGK